MKIVVLTMVNGVDFIGEMKTDPPETGLVPVFHPCAIQMQPPNRIAINPILRGSPVLGGGFSLVNMSAVMWVHEPADKIRQAYQVNRAGLSIAPSNMAVGVNQ